MKEFDEWLQLISRPPSFLLVEDDSRFVQMIKDVISDYKLNCRIDHAQAVAEAKVKLSATTYKLVILDAKLPGEDGIALLEFINRAQMDIPVVLLSGNITTELVHEASRLALVCFLNKPNKDTPRQLYGLFSRILGIQEQQPA